MHNKNKFIIAFCTHTIQSYKKHFHILSTTDPTQLNTVISGGFTRVVTSTESNHTNSLQDLWVYSHRPRPTPRKRCNLKRRCSQQELTEPRLQWSSATLSIFFSEELSSVTLGDSATKSTRTQRVDFFCVKIIGSNIKKFGYHEYPPTTSSFLCIYLIVISGTQCTSMMKC